jgi:integrase
MTSSNAGLYRTPTRARNRPCSKRSHRARLNGTVPLHFHDFRHTFASLLIAQGANVVYVSRQLGHASPNITLSVYAHLFDSLEQAAKTTALLDAGFGTVLETAGSQQLQEQQGAAIQDIAQLVDLQEVR